MKKTLLHIVAIVVLMGVFSVVYGQSVVLDPVPTASQDTLLQLGEQHEFIIRFINPPEETNYNFNNGFRIFSPDGADWSYPARDTTFDTIVPPPALIVDTSIDSILVLNNFDAFFVTTFQRVYFSVDGLNSDTIGYAGASQIPSLGVRPGTDMQVFSVPFLPSAAENAHICIDSSWFRPGGTWKWAAIDLSQQIAPDWSGQQCFKLTTGSDVTEVERDDLPGSFALSQNYPNPFNPTTTFLFDVPRLSHVTIKVYNVLGQEIITLVDEDMAPGSYEADWNGVASSGNSVASGIYFYKMESDGFIKTRKMMLLK
jgi:hypothetical protein